MAVIELSFTKLPSLFYKKCDLLKARVVIYANQHVRLLSPSLWSLSNHSLFGSRSRYCYAIKWIGQRDISTNPTNLALLSIPPK